MKIYNEEKTEFVEIDIPTHYKSVLVNVSGGADSAILLFAIADYLVKEGKTEDVTLSVSTCSNDAKGRWNGRKAAMVIDYVAAATKCPIYMHYTYYRPVQDKKFFHEVEGSLVSSGQVDLIVSGITRNPQGDTTVVNTDGDVIDLADDALPDRDVTFTSLLNETVNDGELVVGFWNPLQNTDKKMVAAMYDHYGVRDGLLKLTRSCEAIPHFQPDGSLINTNFENEPCGNCWWCLERKWAFGEE